MATKKKQVKNKYPTSEKKLNIFKVVVKIHENDNTHKVENLMFIISQQFMLNCRSKLLKMKSKQIVYKLRIIKKINANKKRSMK
jgi:hypothetical protein